MWVMGIQISTKKPDSMWITKVVLLMSAKLKVSRL